MEIISIIIIWLFLSIVAWIIASNKGRFGFGFFLLAVLLSPLIGIIAALIASENRSAVEEKQISSGKDKKCPDCAELVKSEAKICKHCGANLEQRVPSSDQELMDRYGITIENGKYIFRGYKYGSLNQAVNYAKIAPLKYATTAAKDLPELKQELTDRYGITIEGDKYVFRSYKYSNLEDAIKYAKNAPKLAN